MLRDCFESCGLGMKINQRIVVLHALTEQSNPNISVRDVEMASSLRRFGDVVFVNIFAVEPDEIEGRSVLLLVTDSVMTRRSGAAWWSIRKKIDGFSAKCDNIALIVQDDYQFPNRIIKFASKNNATVFTAFPNCDLLYGDSNLETQHWPLMLCDFRLEARLKEFSIPWASRTFDLATRVHHTSIRYGYEGRQKALVASLVGKLAAKQGLIVDVSDRASDRLLGDQWLNFLSKSRFTIGRHGGASRVTRSMRDIFFESSIMRVYSDVSLEAQLNLLNRRSQEVTPMLANSPRILEAAGLEVAQILHETNNSYEMQAWEHYAPLNTDFSNLNQIINFMKSEDGSSMALRCRHYMFGSEKFKSDVWYAKMAEHFGLCRLPPHCFGVVRNTETEIERGRILRALGIDGVQTMRNFKDKSFRDIRRSSGSPSSALIYKWRSLDPGDHSGCD